MIPRTLQVTWTFGIVIWVLICSVGWFAATRDDYAKLNAATACYAATLKSPGSDQQCANLKQSDIGTYKAAIDRKARISRVTAALGSAAALALWFLLGRPGLAAGPRR
jgi:hypothetical protein